MYTYLIHFQVRLNKGFKKPAGKVPRRNKDTFSQRSSKGRNYFFSNHEKSREGFGDQESKKFKIRLKL